MRKVVHLIHHDIIGGGSTVVNSHLRYYGKRYETWVLHGDKTGPITQTCRELGLREIYIPLQNKRVVLLGFFRLLWWLRRIGPDLLILHGQPAGALGALAGKIVGLPRLLYIVHWQCFYTDWDLLRTWRNFILEWLPAHLAHRIITLCESNRYQFLLRRFPVENKITTLSNMIDLSQLPTPTEAEAIRTAHGWTADFMHVVSVCRLAPQKRVDWLLRSWKIVQDSGVAAKLWIVGEGELDTELRNLARELGLEKSCTFLGKQANGIAYLLASDVVAMTTLYETNSVVPMEAMACGRCIVANSADGVRETFTDGQEGFLVTPGNTELFAERLLTLIRDPKLRQQMGEKGKMRAQFFAADKVLDRYVELIDAELAI